LLRRFAPRNDGKERTMAPDAFNSWQVWAVLSAIFAALTAIFAKVGVKA
jgi:hypothetical protein